MPKKYRIMYIEPKAGIAALNANIGKITFSKSGKSLYCKDLELQSLSGRGYKANYADQYGCHFWISGCRKDGNDGLYHISVHVDEDIRAEYWRDIRDLPDRMTQDSFSSRGKHGRHQDLKNKTGNF